MDDPNCPFQVVRTQKSSQSMRSLLDGLSYYRPHLVLLANAKAEIHAAHLGDVPCPVAIYLHGSDLIGHFDTTVPDYSSSRRHRVESLFDRAEWIVANSRSTAQLLGSYRPGFGSRTRVVHLGIDPNRFPRIAEDELKSAQQRWGIAGKKVILCASRLTPDKGQDVLLRAMPRVLERIPHCSLVLAGDGPCRKSLESLASELELDGHVRFIGDQRPNELALQYACCDVFAMLSRRGVKESFGLVYLEANLFGKPVVAGRTGGVPEAVLAGRTGHLVDPQNVEDAADAISHLLQNPAEAAAMGRAGRQRVLDEFTHVRMAEKMLALFSQCPPRRPGRLRSTLWAARKLGRYYGRRAWEKVTRCQVRGVRK